MKFKYLRRYKCIFRDRKGCQSTALGILAVRFFAVGLFAVGFFALRSFRRTEFSPYGNFAVRNFRRKEFSPYGNFAIQNFCVVRLPGTGYTCLGSSSLVNVFSILNRAVRVKRYSSQFHVDSRSTNIFWFLEVKFPTKFSKTVESAKGKGFCTSYLSGLDRVGKLNAPNANI